MKMEVVGNYRLDNHLTIVPDTCHDHHWKNLELSSREVYQTQAAVTALRVKITA